MNEVGGDCSEAGICSLERFNFKPNESMLLRMLEQSVCEKRSYK